MRKKERAERVMQRLEEHYPETPIPLDHSDPFTLPVSYTHLTLPTKRIV